MNRLPFLRILIMLFAVAQLQLGKAQTLRHQTIELGGAAQPFGLKAGEIHAFTAVSVQLNLQAGQSAPAYLLVEGKTASGATAIQEARFEIGETEANLSFGPVFFEAQYTEFSIQTPKKMPLLRATATLYSPTELRGKAEPQPFAPNQFLKGLLRSDACACPQPAFVGRTAWGAPAGQQSGCSPSFTTVSHLVVHHSASVPVMPYSAAVKSVWQAHLLNGWCDIGYNWVIAPDGTLYEGRSGGDNVLGSHFCGKNANTMGVCMLGNFETEQPTAAALATLEKLLAWKACQEGISATGSAQHPPSNAAIMQIAGHRDGCNTLCPGTNLYAKLPSVRLMTATRLSDSTDCDGVITPTNTLPSGAVALPVGTTCTLTQGTVAGATASPFAIPTCNSSKSPTALDVWYSFTASSVGVRVEVRPSSTTDKGLDAVIALYHRRTDNNQLELLDCADLPGGSGVTSFLEYFQAEPGRNYWIRVFDYGSLPPEVPGFGICVRNLTTTNTSQKDEKLNSPKLYPNPSGGDVTLELPTNGGPWRRISVRNAVGKTLYTRSNPSGETLILPSATWPVGNYTVLLEAISGRSTMVRLVVAR